jgi:hypothetical protein
MGKLPFEDLYNKDLQEHSRWRVWQPYDPCPCGCGVIHQKLTKPLDPTLSKVQHSVGCKCKRHVGKRSQRKGKAGQAKMHRNLGGTGPTPSQEESARVYPPVIVMPESKVGGQVPKSFDKFLETEWFRHALDQNVRGIPFGSGAKPSVMIRGRWLIVDTEG